MSLLPKKNSAAILCETTTGDKSAAVVNCDVNDVHTMYPLVDSCPNADSFGRRRKSAKNLLSISNALPFDLAPTLHNRAKTFSLGSNQQDLSSFSGRSRAGRFFSFLSQVQ